MAEEPLLQQALARAAAESDPWYPLLAEAGIDKETATVIRPLLTCKSPQQVLELAQEQPHLLSDETDQALARIVDLARAVSGAQAQAMTGPRAGQQPGVHRRRRTHFGAGCLPSTLAG